MTRVTENRSDKLCIQAAATIMFAFLVWGLYKMFTVEDASSSFARSSLSNRIGGYLTMVIFGGPIILGFALTGPVSLISNFFSSKANVAANTASTASVDSPQLPRPVL